MSRRRAYTQLITAMLIFGSIGLFVRYIPMESSMIAFVRAVLGVAFLLAIIVLKGNILCFSALKGNLLILLLSGSAIGFNWILLFEAYRYTSVAAATLCYYMAPIIVLLLSPLVLRERLTLKKVLCILAAVVGAVLISGITGIGVTASGELKGILFGLGAAVLYASVILLNKHLRNIGSMDRTLIQLAAAGLVLLPYVLLTCDLSTVTVSISPWILLVVVGILHTGIAYYLYFGSMEQLSGQSIAISSYIDPVVAVLVSVILLREPFDLAEGIGAVLILGAALVSELPTKERSKIS